MWKMEPGLWVSPEGVSMMDRRKFLESAACSLTGAWLSGSARAAAVSQSRIEVSLKETQGRISPDLYGYLLENLGPVIYDGVWVGEDSRIPNIGGIRKELIDRMREMKAAVIRWPGGNFADYYDWRDGTGPRAARPRRTNMWWNEMPKEAPSGPQRYDPNQFGTPEFMRFCQLTGGRPYLNANIRGLTAQDFSRWVEYCNSPPDSTTLADLRKADGSPEAYGVRYWGIGNEVWGAGGPSTADEFAPLYKRFTANIPNYGVDLAFIACGGPPPATDYTWMRAFLKNCSRAIVPIPIAAMSLHYYATFPAELMKPGQTFADFMASYAEWSSAMLDSVTFNATDWYDVLVRSARMDSIIASCWKAMEELDPSHKIKLAVDEWGAFYRSGAELSPIDIRGHAVTLRDALAVALTLDIFHHHTDKLLLACFTGLINQEGGLFRALGEKFVATPIYYVFKLYSAHQGGQAVRASFESPTIHYEQRGQSASLWGLNGSASVRDRELTLTVVNPHVSSPNEALITLRDGAVSGGTVATLTHTDIHAQNTFERPNQVTPVLAPLKAEGSSFLYRFPPASVTCFTLGN
jgi:alpha-N-arabinofuranosidase